MTAINKKKIQKTIAQWYAQQDLIKTFLTFTRGIETKQTQQFAANRDKVEVSVPHNSTTTTT